MQIPIDFYTALLDSGNVIIVVLFLSLLIYMSRVREIYADIGVGTQHALIAYGLSGVAMALASFVSINEAYRYLITGTGAFFLGMILIAELWILLSEKRAMQGTIIIILTIIGVYINNFMEEFMGVPLYFMMIGLSILLLGSVYFALVLLRENPSTFTASLLMVLVLYMATWVIGMTGWTFTNPKFYIVQVIPLIVAATVFSSIRRPWKSMLAVFIMLFTVTLTVPLIANAYAAESWTILFFVGMETFTAFCLIAPLNYFLDQHTKSGAKTPLYLGSLITFVAILVATHALAWSIFISDGLVWDQYLVFVDVIIGSAAIISFMLAAVSSLYGDWVQTITRESMLVFGTAAALLTFPLTQPAFITNQMVWLAIGVVVAMGTLLFVRLSIRIARSGGRTPAVRLMMFIISTLMIAIVSMYADLIPPVPPNVPIVVILLLAFAGILALLSNPPVMARLSRTVKELEDLEDLGVKEDGSIIIE